MGEVTLGHHGFPSPVSAIMAYRSHSEARQERVEGGRFPCQCVFLVTPNIRVFGCLVVDSYELRQPPLVGGESER